MDGGVDMSTPFSLVTSFSTWLKSPLRQILGICFCILCGALVAFLPREAVFPFIIFVLGLSFGIICISQYEKPEALVLLTIFLSAYLIRALLSVIFYLLSFAYQDELHLGFLFLNDGYAYHEDAFRMVKMKEFGFDPIIYGVSFWSTGRPIAPVPYEFWNCFVYGFTGKSPLSMFLLNSFLGALTVLVLYDLIRLFFWRQAALRASWIYALWPSLILWSTQNLKDPMIICSLTLFVSSVLISFKRPTILRVSFLIASGTVLFKIQKFFFLVVMVSTILAVLLTLATHKRRWVRLGMLCLLLGFLLMMAPAHLLNLGTLTKLQNSFIQYLWREHETFLQSQFETLNALRKVRAQGGSAFLVNINLASPLRLLMYLPILLAYACLGPFPWQAFGFFKLFGAAEMLVFYFFIPAFFRGVRFVLKEKKPTALLLLNVIFVVMTSVALLDSNLGTAVRHRASVLPLIFTFIAVGWHKQKKVSTLD